jgi:hypothetical protein
VRVYIDLDTDELVSSPGIPQSVTSLSLKRNELASLEVQFIRKGQVVELDPTAIGIFELKPLGQYDATPLTGAADWVQFGVLENTYYLFQFTLINTALDGLFGVGVLEDQSKVDLMGEIEWIIAEVKRKTPTLTVSIANNVIRTGDAIPGGGLPPDYLVDDTDPINPQFVFDDTTLEPLVTG